MPNVQNSNAGYAKHLTHNLRRQMAQFSDLKNLWNLQFSARIILAILRPAPPLFKTVSDIFRWRPSPQMTRIATGWVIAGMTDLKISSHWSAHAFKDNPMRDSPNTPYLEASIATLSRITSGPRPTGIDTARPINLGPSQAKMGAKSMRGTATHENASAAFVRTFCWFGYKFNRSHRILLHRVRCGGWGRLHASLSPTNLSFFSIAQKKT